MQSRDSTTVLQLLSQISRALIHPNLLLPPFFHTGCGSALHPEIGSDQNQAGIFTLRRSRSSQLLTPSLKSVRWFHQLLESVTDPSEILQLSSIETHDQENGVVPFHHHLKQLEKGAEVIDDLAIEATLEHVKSAFLPF